MDFWIFQCDDVVVIVIVDHLLVCERLVSVGVYALLLQLLFDARVP